MMSKMIIFGLWLLAHILGSASAQLFWVPGNSLSAIGPSAGTVGSPSSSFTVTLATGTFNGSQQVMIADDGQAGTITPSVGSPGVGTVTVTPTNGATGFTFTYSAASSGLKLLSLTNGQLWWINPLPLQYAAASASFPAACNASGTTACPTTSFINSIGFNSNISNNPIYTLANLQADLAYIGTKNLRDAGVNESNASTYTALAAAGSATMAWILGGSTNGCTDVAGLYGPWFLSQSTFLAIYPNFVSYLDGSNQTNSLSVCYKTYLATSAQTAAGGTVLNFSSVPQTILAAVTGTPGGNGYATGISVADLTADSPAANIDGGSAYAFDIAAQQVSVTQLISVPNEILVACVMTNNGPVSGYTDALGLTWTKRAAANSGTPSQSIEEWYAIGPSSGTFPMTDQIRFSQQAGGSALIGLGVLGIIGANLSVPFDSPSATVKSGTAIDPITTFTTTHANTMGLSCFRQMTWQYPTAGGGASPLAIAGFPIQYYQMFMYAPYVGPQSALVLDSGPPVPPRPPPGPGPFPPPPQIPDSNGAWADAIVLNVASPSFGATRSVAPNTTMAAATSTTVTLSRPIYGAAKVGDIIPFTANQPNCTACSNNSYPAANVMWQQDLYTSIKQTLQMAVIPVLNFAGQATGQPLNGQVGALGTADYNNQQVYPASGSQPAFQLVMSYATPNGYFVIAGKPLVITAGGYPTVLDNANGVDQATQARLLVNFFLDAFNLGAASTYTYEMIDAACVSAAEINNYGVFDCNNNPKTSAVSLKNLISILADNGGQFSPGTLGYSVSGLPAQNTGTKQGGGYSMLFEKANGHFDIVVWNEPPIWNSATNSEITPPTVNVTVSLGGTKTTVNVYDPIIGTTPITTLHSVSSVPLALVKDALIVEVIP